MKMKKECVGDIPIGTKVKLVQESRYWRENRPNNPQNVIGTVIDYHGNGEDSKQSTTTLDYEVDWSNGNHNTYHITDLEVVEYPKEHALPRSQEEKIINNYQIY